MMAASVAVENPERSAQLLRRCATAGVVLVYAVIVASAYLRLARAGLGCADWPACYGALPPRAASGGELPWLFGAMRVIHRIAAAAVGFVVIVIAVLCFGAGRQRFGRTLIAGSLAALTVFLALLGRLTAGAHPPAVTLGNLLGGMTMLGLMGWLRLHAAVTLHAPPRGRRASWLWLGVALIAVQVALGALVSAHSEALPALTLTAEPARRALHLAHRLGALVVLIYWLTLAVISLRNQRSHASYVAVTAAVLIVQCAVGAAAVLLSLPLALAVAHNALAAFAVIAAMNAVFQSRPADEASVSAACQMVTSK